MKPSGQYQAGLRMSGYIQIFRNGVFEYVESIGQPQQAVKNAPSEPVNNIPLEGIETRVLESFQRAVALQTNLLGVPIVIMLSLTRIKGARFVDRNEPGGANPWGETLFPRSNFLVPDILEQDLTKSGKAILRPLFNTLWNAGNFPYSQSYDDQGNWVRRR